MGQLGEFVPRSGAYGRDRNHVVPGHTNVSRLSPAIRHRLLLESEVIDAVRERYAFSTLEKFIQEVYWRGYWKAWLSLRPQVWTSYLSDLQAIKADPANDEILSRAEQAANGCSGLPVMDNFATELTESGYMHNHARMWYAAWWVHVERLPWQLGAEFFFKYLLDGDPASNTLSWRWVAGLQTPGKTYLPRRSNIEKYLAAELLDPTGMEVLEKPIALLPENVEKPQITQPELPDFPIQDGERSGLWIHEEDLLPEKSPLADLSGVCSAIVLGNKHGWNLHAYPSRKMEWLSEALDDTADRCRQAFECEVHRVDADDPVHALITWAKHKDLKQVVAIRPSVGPLNDVLPAIIKCLSTEGIKLALVDREEDIAIRKNATGGFFNYWKKSQKQIRERHA